MWNTERCSWKNLATQKCSESIILLLRICTKDSIRSIMCDAQSIVYYGDKVLCVCKCVMYVWAYLKNSKGDWVTQRSKEKTHSLCRSREKKRTTQKFWDHLKITFTCCSAGSPRLVSSELVKLARSRKYGSPVKQRFFNILRTFLSISRIDSQKYFLFIYEPTIKYFRYIDTNFRI